MVRGLVTPPKKVAPQCVVNQILRVKVAPSCVPNVPYLVVAVIIITQPENAVNAREFVVASMIML